ncbi:MAG: sugar phosphate isomerase/epimerase [Ruminococcaceae bacterium]|nr:sugar phosphate isomerase/epimerase [Oscillospiraceae bacterium]
MQNKINISGFADEIGLRLSTQLKVVNALGMKYVCLRTINGKSIAKYTVSEAEKKLVPALKEAGIGVSSLGSPIGKVNIDDDAAFETQLRQLDTLCKICKLLDCKYIRVFSFFVPQDKDPAIYKDKVLSKLRQFVEIAEKHKIILLHENEKDIYGDIASRCRIIFDEIKSDYLKAAFDSANFVQCGENALEAYELLKDKVIYIHIKDALKDGGENVVCGTGDGQIPEVLRCAFETGYNGFLTLEPHLVLFSSMKSLEGALKFKKAKAKNGADGYTKQYNALCEILNSLDIDIQ